MSTVLAKQFYKIINDACNNVNCKENTTTLSYSITESEKNEIKNICRLIDEELSKLQRTTNEIILKQSEIEKLTDSEPDQKWKKSLECDVNWQKKPFNESCQKLEKYCGDYVSLYGAKKHLHWSLEKIYDIANEISSKIYKITCPDDFKSENLSLAVSNFNKYYNFLLRVIEKHII